MVQNKCHHFIKTPRAFFNTPGTQHVPYTTETPHLSHPHPALKSPSPPRERPALHRGHDATKDRSLILAYIRPRYSIGVLIVSCSPPPPSSPACRWVKKNHCRNTLTRNLTTIHDASFHHTHHEHRTAPHRTASHRIASISHLCAKARSNRSLRGKPARGRRGPAAPP